MSAALWCCELGLETALLEREPRFGGQLHVIHNEISNYLGVAARDGGELLEMFERSIETISFDRLLGCEVLSLDVRGKTIKLADGSSLEVQALIIATGVRRRRLNVPGEAELAGKGIIHSGVRDKETLRGRRVIIVGGGDAAIENALILSEVAESVTVVHRRSDFKARPEFLIRARNGNNIRFETDSVVREIEGGSEVTGLVLSDTAGNLRVDSRGETNVSGVFAVGDVANPQSPTISTAVGSGATAAKTIYCSLRG